MRLFFISLCVLISSCASVYTEIELEHPPQKVWSVLSSIEKYPDWNPVMVYADGELKQGNHINYTFRENEEKEYKIRAKVHDLKVDQLINHVGGTYGIISFDHKYILEPSVAGTKLIHKEDYTGIYLLFWDYQKMQDLYEKVNFALKKRLNELP